MPIQYAVLRTRVENFRRQDDDPLSPHFHIQTRDAHGRTMELAVNAKSTVGNEQVSMLQVFQVNQLANHPVVSGLDQIPAGLTPLPPDRRGAHNALDYLRAPLFPFSIAELLPATRSGPDDDIQDRLASLCRQMQEANGELFAWGAPVANNTVLHDIHMNQGNQPNPPQGSDFSRDNGVSQDGGLVFRFSQRTVGLFLKFQSQLLPTDARGFPLPGSVSLPDTIDPRVLPVPGPGASPGSAPAPLEPAVYIERALVNPVGDDVGKEIIVLGNSTLTTENLSGWGVVDRAGQTEILRGVLLPPGSSVQVVLSGDFARLGNRGGVIRLVDPSGQQVHAVSYSREQAVVEGRFIRFDT
jgi:uncharacterized protein YukJ